jgi:hypothetical protein
VETQRSARVGPASRPVSIPEDLIDDNVVKASGVVVLPHHVRWGEPVIDYNLDDPADRIRAYEQVLREGTEEDVRYFIRISDLVEMWDQLLLPAYVREGWAEWLLKNRQLHLGC